MRWPPYQHVFFDCDSTLTTIEGIDILAEAAGKGWRVERLTRAAMEGELDLAEVYNKRLRAVRPTQAQVTAVRQVYKQNVVEDAAAVIAALQRLGHKVYIISGGLAEPVVEFGVYLGVPRANIYAVQVEYNELSGTWWRNQEDVPNKEKRYRDFRDGALTVSNGKAKIVRQIVAERGGRALLIGDGISDLLASKAVDLFVGYGGVVSRERVLQEAPCFLHSLSLAPLLALASGPAILPQLYGTPHEDVSRKSLELFQKGAVTFNNERFREKFWQAYQTVYPRSNGSATGDPGRPDPLDDRPPHAGSGRPNGEH